MSKQSGKNPYVHPDPKHHMLNTVGNDGYSFDEKDDDYEDEHENRPKAVPNSPLNKWLEQGGTEEEFRRFQREAVADQELGLNSPLSDGHYEALGLEAPGE